MNFIVGSKKSILLVQNHTTNLIKWNEYDVIARVQFFFAHAKQTMYLIAIIYIFSQESA